MEEQNLELFRPHQYVCLLDHTILMNQTFVHCVCFYGRKHRSLWFVVVSWRTHPTPLPSMVKERFTCEELQGVERYVALPWKRLDMASSGLSEPSW